MNGNPVCVRILSGLVLSAAICSSASAQSPMTGFPPLGSFAGGPFDTVNLANLDVHFAIPVFARQGVGIPFTYGLSYDSLIWVPVTAGGSQSWHPVTNWGWRDVTEAATGYVTYENDDETDCYYGRLDYLGGTTDIYTGFIYHDPTGGLHPFPSNAHVTVVRHIGSDPSNHCPQSRTDPISNAVATDNSGYILTTDSRTATVNARGGLTIQVPHVQHSTGAGSVTDVNGNRISISAGGVITDTLGTTALTVSGSPPSNPPSCSPAVTYTYTAPNSGLAAITVSYKPYTVQTAFGVSNIGEFPPTSACLVDKITLPDTTDYQFTYEWTYGTANSVTGRIAQVTLPTGGTIGYDYNGYECHYRCNAMMADGSPAFMYRSLGGGTWSYFRAYQSGSNQPAQTTTVVMDPPGNETDLNFSSLYETGRLTYQGTGTSKVLLRKTFTCYNGNYSNCETAIVNSPINYRAFYNYADLAGDAAYEYWYDGYGNQTGEADHDFPHENPVIRKISTSYYSPLCLSLNRCDLPASVQVLDGASNQKALTNNTYDGKGNAIQADRWVSGSTYLTSRSSYNANGTLQTTTDPNGTVTHHDSAGYSCNGAFPNTVSVPSHFVGTLTTRYTYNCTGGVITSVMDPNNATVSTTYNDPYFWRRASTTDPLRNITYYNYYGVNNSGGSAVTMHGQVESVMLFNGGNSTTDGLATPDGYGRPWLQQTRQAPGSGSWDTVQTWYDGSGRILWVARPFATGAGQYSGGGIPATGYFYDGLGRYVDIEDWTGRDVHYTYNFNDTKVMVLPAPSGENPKTRQLEYDALGRLKSVCEVTSAAGSGACSQDTTATGFFSSYSYDPLGNLTGVSQSGQARSFSYDGLSRILSEGNPENGTTSYTYDTDGTCGSYRGDKVKRIDAAQNVTCYVWDGLHRLLNVNYVSGPNAANTMSKEYSYDVNYGWDGISLGSPLGRLTETHACCLSGGAWTGWEMFGYNARGETTDVFYYDHDSSYSSPTHYHTVNSYFPNGVVAQRNGYYGDTGTSSFSNTLVYSIDGKGRPVGLTDQTTGDRIWNSAYTRYNPADQPDRLVFYPSADDESFTWDPNSGRMTNWQSDLNTIGRSQYGALTWNANGTLKTLNITDTANPANNQTCTYGYDDLARLTGSQCGSVWGQNFSYDAFGNIWKTGNVSFQPTSYSGNRINLAGFSYDGMGNVTSDGAHTYVYDAEGRPVKVDGTTIRYDGFDRPFEEDRPSGKVTDIIYAPDGHKFAFMNGTTPTYIAPLAAGVQAVYTAKSPAGVAYWRHSDWLGSTRMSDTRAGTVYYDGALAPFGESYAELGTTDRSFTGQTQDTALGLYDFSFREQSPSQGRWLAPDPMGLGAVDLTNPQTWNRYGYLGNQPLNATDPLGLFIVDCMWDGCPHDNSGGGGGGYYGGLAGGTYLDGVLQTIFNTSGLGGGGIGLCPPGQSNCIIGADNQYYSWQQVDSNGDGPPLYTIKVNVDWPQNQPATSPDCFMWSGYYGGPCYTGGQWMPLELLTPQQRSNLPAPTDAVDACDQPHDYCYYNARVLSGTTYGSSPSQRDISVEYQLEGQCDLEVIACLNKVPYQSLNADAQREWFSMQGPYKIMKGVSLGVGH